VRVRRQDSWHSAPHSTSKTVRLGRKQRGVGPAEFNSNAVRWPIASLAPVGMESARGVTAMRQSARRPSPGGGQGVRVFGAQAHRWASRGAARASKPARLTADGQQPATIGQAALRSAGGNKLAVGPRKGGNRGCSAVHPTRSVRRRCETVLPSAGGKGPARLSQGKLPAVRRARHSPRGLTARQLRLGDVDRKGRDHLRFIRPGPRASRHWPRLLRVCCRSKRWGSAELGSRRGARRNTAAQLGWNQASHPEDSRWQKPVKMQWSNIIDSRASCKLAQIESQEMHARELRSFLQTLPKLRVRPGVNFHKYTPSPLHFIAVIARIH